MEAKPEAEGEVQINMNNEDVENTAGKQNINGDKKIIPELTIKNVINASIEPTNKEDIGTSPNTTEGGEDDSIIHTVKEEPIETNHSEPNEQVVNLPTEEAKKKAVEKSTDIKDESKSTKQVNPLKRKRCRPPKRKRMTKINRVMVTNDKASAFEGASDLSLDTLTEAKDEVEYCLTVSNLPKSWSFMEIKNYIDTECGPVDEIEMIKDDKTGIGAIKLSYQLAEECKSAVQKLKDKEVGGKKLILEITVVSLESDCETKSETTESSEKSWKPDLDSWEVDLHGMYGLKLQYLKSLGISPPLDKWVHVSNFRCDKSELREVMEMAGNVQMCSVFAISHRYANVMYSHPLEAVQAVSMLNNQLFYGQQLRVAMDRSPANTILLPKGLTNIGKGLGLNGKPLRNIVKHYERFVDNKDCLINPAVFDIPENNCVRLNGGFEPVEFRVKSVEEFNYPIEDKKAVKVTTVPVATVQTPPKPVQAPPKAACVQTPLAPIANFTPNFQQRPFVANFRPFPGPQANGPVPVQGPQGPPSQMGPIGPPMQLGPPRPQPHPTARPLRPPGPFVRPFAPQMNQPVPVGPPGWGQGPVRPGPVFTNEPVKLILSNLPPSTTFPLLCEKMSEWGHVVCIQLTTPGCAVVTFANRMQADACLQNITMDEILRTILFR